MLFVGMVAPMLGLTLAGGEASSHVRLVYQRSAETLQCPSEREIKDDIAAHLGYDPFHEPAQQIISATVRRSGPVLSATVSLTDGSGRALGRRELEARSDDCAQ